MGFPDGLAVKSLPDNVGDLGWVPGSGRFPGDGSGNPTLVFLPGKSHGQRSLVPGVVQSMGVTKIFRHNLATKQQPFL